MLALCLFACSSEPSGPAGTDRSDQGRPARPPGYLNAEYSIGGLPIRLVDGVAETAAAPGSAVRIVTRYLGNELWHDFDADGREDVVFLLTQETGGSGTFYYVVAALNRESGFVGSEGMLLGDRIAPRTSELGPNDIVVIDYTDHAPGESLSSRPSIDKSIDVKLDPATLRLGEVARNFEGEADSARMSLQMKTWVWIDATYADGQALAPRLTGAFTLTFSPNGDLLATTDCNSLAGGYTAAARELRLGDFATTRRFCDGSQEGAYTQMLRGTSSYFFTSRGELMLETTSGAMTFR